MIPTKPLGREGAEIHALGLGVFRMPAEDTARMTRTALELGYRHIDTAQIYGNEADVGRGMAEAGVPREQIFLTTKVWVDHYRTPDLLRSVEESLARLRTDYVDLLLLHWPGDKAPLAEQIDALNQTVSCGWARHIGVSNFNIKLMREAAALSAAPLVTNQIEFHPYLDQDAVRAEAAALGMTVTAYFGMADGKVLTDPLIGEIAARLGKTPAQIALRWLVQQDNVVTLTKTLQRDRAEANARVFDFALSADDMARIAALARPDGRLVSPDGLAPDWD
ncbi:aldo/keto reductase [Achromobacter sp. Marseille-Q0513]|uniref:aldo/keto reductase n=1 Tax=Achromobacter sp. Marseille-Q0513 TaxID=2829161 RepID=UPI001B9110F9|nr:aldo/keto reductase [Achromobacter sp. Marseille-Q0513]MBR8655704.1 aldo/keto reductase [Achromobacter sp. Marseille-Q0513]